jgi:hypothetical protein
LLTEVVCDTFGQKRDWRPKPQSKSFFGKEELLIIYMRISNYSPSSSLIHSQIRIRNQVDWAEAKRALNATITEVIHREEEEKKYTITEVVRREEEEKKECEGVAR